jgi:hypothetical protein
MLCWLYRLGRTAEIYAFPSNCPLPTLQIWADQKIPHPKHFRARIGRRVTALPLRLLRQTFFPSQMVGTQGLRQRDRIPLRLTPIPVALEPVIS